MCILSCPTSSIANCKICTHSANNFLLTYVHVEDCNKCIKICASSWSLAKVILRCTVRETSKFAIQIVVRRYGFCICVVYFYAFRYICFSREGVRGTRQAREMVDGTKNVQNRCCVLTVSSGPGVGTATKIVICAAVQKCSKLALPNVHLFIYCNSSLRVLRANC